MFDINSVVHLLRKNSTGVCGFAQHVSVGTLREKKRSSKKEAHELVSDPKIRVNIRYRYQTLYIGENTQVLKRNTKVRMQEGMKNFQKASRRY